LLNLFHDVAAGIRLSERLMPILGPSDPAAHQGSMSAAPGLGLSAVAQKIGQCGVVPFILSGASEHELPRQPGFTVASGTSLA
jgi:hypothetical protein